MNLQRSFSKQSVGMAVAVTEPEIQSKFQRQSISLVKNYMFCCLSISRYCSACVGLLVLSPKSIMHTVLLPRKSTDSSGHTDKSVREGLLSGVLSATRLKCVSYSLNKSNTLKHKMFDLIYPNLISHK